jgi:cytochrome c peroxidase
MKISMKIVLSLFFVILLVIVSIVAGPANAEKDACEKCRAIVQPLRALPSIPADNAMTPGKIKFGKMLYWDRRR